MTGSVSWGASVGDTREIKVSEGKFGWDVAVFIGRLDSQGTLELTRETAQHLADEIYDVLSIGPDDGSDDLHTRIKEDRAY